MGNKKESFVLRPPPIKVVMTGYCSSCVNELFEKWEKDEKDKRSDMDAMADIEKEIASIIHSDCDGADIEVKCPRCGAVFTLSLEFFLDMEGWEGDT